MTESPNDNDFAKSVIEMLTALYEHALTLGHRLETVEGALRDQGVVLPPVPDVAELRLLSSLQEIVDGFDEDAADSPD